VQAPKNVTQGHLNCKDASEPPTLTLSTELVKRLVKAVTRHWHPGQEKKLKLQLLNLEQNELCCCDEWQV
jgi:hypothetical protein